MFYSGGESDYVVEPAALAEELIQAFDGWETWQGVGEWTALVQDFLQEKVASVRKTLGRGEKELEHISTQPKKRVSEFMLDAVWWRRDPNGGKEGLALAVECEWAALRPGSQEDRGTEFVGTEVEYDFEKLVAVKSPLKLMIFVSAESRTESLELMQNTIVQRLERLLAHRSDHISGETYILVDAATKGRRKAWIWKAGRPEEPRFMSLADYKTSKSPEARRARLRNAQESAQRYLVPGRAIEDEMIAERREEARREGLDS